MENEKILQPTLFPGRFLKFNLLRLKDVTGVSGTGVVAQGVQFPDGTAVMRWCALPYQSTCVYASVSELMAIHGHDGNTVLRWIDF